MSFRIDQLAVYNLATVGNSITAGSFVKSGGTSSQFLKADGSVDSSTYITGITSGMVTTALGYTPVPNTRTLTINGTSYDLSADRSWTITSGVSSVSGSGAGISVSPTTGAVVVSNTGVTSNVAGTGISVSGATGAVTITNTGVTSIVAGTAITVSASTGAVTINNAGVTSVNGNTGAITGVLTTSNYSTTLDSVYLKGTTSPSTPGNFTLSIGNNGSYSYIQSHSSQPLYLNPVGNTIYINSTTYVASQLIRTAAGTGWLSGNYASSETASTTGAIYSIGGSYYPTSTLLNSMYGVGYTHTAQGQMPSGASGWGFYVAANGTVRAWLGADNGNIIAIGDIYANTSSLVATQTWVSTNYAPKNGSTSNAFSVSELTYLQTLFNPSAGARTTLSPMSTKMFDNYFSGIGLGSDYGTVMEYYSRGGHVDTQVYFDAGGGSWYRTAAYASGFGSWQKYVTENGGTWNINITGNSATTSQTNFSALSISGAAVATQSWVSSQGYITGNQTITLSGDVSGSGTTSISVIVNQIDGWTFVNTGSNSGTAADSINSNGVSYVAFNISLFGQTDGALYSQAYSSSWQHQIYGDYRTGQIAIRGKNSGTWQSWRVVLDSSNYNSYSPTLTGGGASGTWGINITGTASSETLSTVTGRGNSTGSNIITSANMYASVFYDYDDNGYYLNPASSSRLYSLTIQNTIDFPTSSGASTSRGSGPYSIYQEAGSWTYPYPDLCITFHTGISFGANASYQGMRFYTDYDLSTQVMSINNGSDPLGGGNVYVNNSLQAGSSLRAPIFYDSDNTAYYGNFADSTTSLYLGGGISQNNLVGRPYAVWGSVGTTGAVVIKFPGGTGNYGMIHAVIDVYEYNGNDACTIIVGGHNWGSAWYNYGAQVIGNTDKSVRVGVKDGQYCIVIGNGSSSWSYGQVVLRKIQNGTYYQNVMNVSGLYTVNIESDTYSWVSGDLRNLETPVNFYAGGSIYAGGNIVATQTWANGAFVPLRTQSNWGGSGVIDNVVGMLAWKNYGNGHVIFDASNSTSPSGTGVNNTNSQIAWSSTYPTLMGWNGYNTYGVRVDSARVADSASSATSATQVVTIQDAVPSGVNGQLWWESDTGRLKVYYGSSSAWVDSMPMPDMSLYYPKAGGPIYGDVSIQQTLNVVGNVLIQGTLTETSDISLKENVVSLEGSLDKVMKLKGVSFNKKITPHIKEVGFIAQEVEAVIPELVTETDQGIKTVSYSRVTAVLVETIKEQQSQIDELKDLLNKLILGKL